MNSLYKTLAKSMRQYIKPSILTMIFLAGEVFAEMMIPYLMAKVLDRGFETKDIQYIIQIGLLMAVLALISMTCGILGGKFSSDASAGFAANLREDIYRNIQRFSFQNIDRFSTPSLITRLTTDITNIQFAFQMVLKTVIRAPFMIVFAFIMAAYTNLKLSMIILAVIPFLGAALIFLIYRVHPYFVKVFRQYDHLNQTVQEVINGVRVVKSFVREEKEIDRFKEASEQIKQVFMKAEKLIALNSPIMQIAVYSSLLVVYWFGAKFVVAGSMTPGTLTSFIMYMLQILNSLMMFSMIFVMIVISEASCERVAEVLTEKSTLTNPENPVTTIENGEIEFKDVSFKYPGSDLWALRHVNMKFKIGSRIAVVGENGSGKSTFIKLLCRLYDPQEGVITLNGIDIRKYRYQDYLDLFSVVFQDFQLLSQPLGDNVAGSMHYDKTKVEQCLKDAGFEERLRELPEGLDTYLYRDFGKDGIEVSGGEAQKIAIARALYKDAPFIILDEPTAALDPLAEAEIYSQFNAIVKDKTAIFISHRLSSCQFCDEILVFDQGTIVQKGTHATLVHEEKGKYSALWHAQAQYYE